MSKVVPDPGPGRKTLVPGSGRNGTRTETETGGSEKLFLTEVGTGTETKVF